MIAQKSAQIHLASARSQSQTEGYSCWSTFHFDKNQKNTKKTFGSLLLFNYQVIAPKQKTTIVTPSETLNYILPLYGAINFKSEKPNYELIATEQIAQIVSSKESSFEISNPFENNVSYLQIGFKNAAFPLENDLKQFDFRTKNKLISLFENPIANGFIAQFDGRKEAHYQLKNKQNGIFVYIIQGAFEFENILLESGDALSLKEIEAVEWESLSRNAMLLLIEIPLA